jgi:hypothetical protein
LACRTDMPHRKKITFLSFNKYWNNRKEIYKVLIDKGEIHPDYACLMFNPLEESIIQDDLVFAFYLLEKGACVISKIIRNQISNKMALLLQGYTTTLCDEKGNNL